MKHILAVLLAACTGACAPVVTHSPRVQPGVMVVATTGGSGAFCDTACELDLRPQVALGAHRGWAATQTRAGFSFGGNISVSSADLDAYVQAPTGWTGGMQAGAGALAGVDHAMPYLQLGRMRADGSGWYTTQGYAWLFRRSARVGVIGDGEADEDLEPDLVRPRYWAPSLAFRGGGGTGVSLYVSGAFGTADAWEYDIDGQARRSGRETIRHVMVGVILDTRAPASARRPTAQPSPSSASN
ncbi:MAG TPA: hypothetical protein VEQ60_03345 [Longimicrobium sp.]|nr:hypothetical protein [Longimicrobium sp.]